jgi:hypothetical protein
VRPVFVVVLDVVDDEPLKLALVPDEGAVGKLTADRPDPAFGGRVGHRGADRCLEDLEALGSKDLVEGVDELAASVSNQRSCASELVVVKVEQVASGLGCPGSGRVGRCAGVEDFSGGNVDEEQHVVATEPGVSTVKKSQATAAWEFRNSDHVTSERRGAGSMSLLLRICLTVEEAMRWPRAISSRWRRR